MSDAEQQTLYEARWRAMLDRAPDLIYRFRLLPVAGFEHVSHAALRVTGHAAEALMADPSLFRMLIAPDALLGDDGSVTLAADAPVRIFHQISRPDGDTAWVEVDRTCVLDGDGRVEAVEGAVRDATIRVGSESHAGFEARIVGAIRDAVVVVGVDGKIAFWNAGAERLLGLPAAEALGRSIDELLPGDVLVGTRPLLEALDATMPWEGDLRLVRPEGDIRRLEVMSYPLIDERDGPSRVIILWDVTAERDRTDAVARLAAIVEQADDAIYTVGLSTPVLTWNRGAERLTGMPAAQVVGSTSPLVLPTPEDRAGVRDRALAGETVRIDPAAFRHADGTLIPVSILAGPVRSADGDVVAISVIARDERPRAEAERELRFRDSILAAVQDAVIVTDTDLALRYWSPAAERLFGVPAEEALGRRLDELVGLRKLGSAAPPALGPTLGSGPGPGSGPHDEAVRGDVVCTRADGRTFTGEMVTSRLVDVDGTQMEMALIRDVTALRQASEDSAQLAAIVENAGDVIVGTSIDGMIRTWNPGAERLLGYTAGEMVGRTIAAFVATDLLPSAFAMRDRVIAGGEASVSAEFAHIARDGTRIPVWATIAAIRDPSGVITGISVLAQDLRGRKELEEQLRQAQKLEAVGRLAGGVAHDFNNLLTAVTGYGSLLETELPADSAALEDVRQILRATERASELTRGLLDFSRGRPREMRVVALDPLVDDLLPMLRRLIPERVELLATLDSRAALRVDLSDIELVLVNLAVNAAEAMPDGGRLRIETALVDLDAPFASTHLGVTPGRHAELLVADTGTGMTDEVRAHIFEPFFSTKAGGGATGMGLATVHANVERAGGTVWVSTTPGEGTTFRILIPASEVVAEPVPPVAPPQPPGGTERVLLVEDDALVRALATAVLRRGGYTITVKGDPRDALEIDPHDLDLLVTDVVMPGIGGQVLAARLRETRPDLRVVFMSGFVERSVTTELETMSTQPVLQKPFTPASLLAAVRGALDA